MRYIKFIFALNFVFACFNVYAKPLFKPDLNFKGWNFIENKGQLASKEIKYYGHQGGVSLYCQPGKISFVFTKCELKETDKISEATSQQVSDVGVQNPEPLHLKQPFDRSTLSALRFTISTSRADLILLNSNPTAQIIASDQQEYYENYYLANIGENGITNVHTYKTITYKSIYPYIDLVLHARSQGVKYEFVVYPGGKVGDIQLQWNGIEGIKKIPSARAGKDSGIEYSCSLGKMDEGNPISFQGERPVKSSFNKSGNQISFKIERYDKTKSLVIDPYLIWGTYFGGTKEEYGSGVATDAGGNAYLTGGTSSLSGIATEGAYQTSYNGSIKEPLVAYLAKFTNNGKMLWATYYGDSSYSSKVATDGFGNVYITGNTIGKSGIATKGAYQVSYAGTNGGGYAEEGDAFLVKFDYNGIRQWGTYFGGPGWEEGTGVTTDSLGNIYITSNTTSSTGIATNGAFQTNSGGSSGVSGGGAFLAKFNGGGSLKWATYYGVVSPGSKIGTTSYSIANDQLGNVYIAGTTGILSGIATNGAYQSSYKGSGIPIAEDGFLVKFNSTGDMQWGTYYGGLQTNIAGISTDFSGNIYLSGSTSDTAIATEGAYQLSNAGGVDGFLAKFNTKGAELWATYYGGPSNDFPLAVATDLFGGVYITGQTNSSSGISTSGAYQSAKTTSESPFLAKFNRYGDRVWASYFGIDTLVTQFYLDGDVCTDASGNVYMTTGAMISDSGISTSGVYQASYSGAGDAFLAKFRIISNNDAGISNLSGPPSSICAGVKNIQVQLQNYGLDTLDSAILNFSVNGKLQSSYHWFGHLAPDSAALVTIGNYDFASGIYLVKSWTSKPNGTYDSLPGNDTVVMEINVNAPPPIINASQSTYAICTGTHIKIGANAQPNYTYSWSSMPVGFSSTLPDPVVNPGTNTTYNLTVTDTTTGCTNQNSANVSVSLLKAPVIDVGKDQSLCAGDSARIGSTALSGDGYLWKSDPVGYSSTVANPVVSPLATTSYLLTVTSPQGCTNFDSVIITVNPKPVIVTGHVLVLCAGLVIPLGGPPNPDYTYSWTSTPPGFFSNLSDPTDSPMVTTEYHLKVTIPATGCTDSGNISFGVLPQPAAPVIDVKNIGGFEYIFKLKNPDTAANYIWSFGDSSITHNSFYYDTIMLHTYPGNGVYKLTVEAAENHCVAYTHDVIDINQSFGLNIFPNPFDLQTEIQYTLINPAHVKVSLIDEVGRQIGTLMDQQQNPGEYNLKYDGAAWKTRSGMYFIIFQLDDQVIVKKIIQLDSIFN